MGGDNRRPPRVPASSSGKPDATCRAAGLLQQYPAAVAMVLLQGVEDATPAPEVGRALTEIGLDMRDWVPQVISAAPLEPADVRLTVCVPT